jgi:bifunctional non-homologous end joining protein LigD
MKFLEPCVPTLKSVPPTGDAWLHEIKIDGWRCQLVKEGRRIHFFSRSGNDLHRRLGTFAENFAGLAAKSATIDGELTVADPEGRPDFHGLTGAMRRRKRDLMFVAFDLLELNGKDLRAEPLETRRHKLQELLQASGIGCSCFSEAFDDGPALLKACAGLGLEGIVSKRRDAPYRAGKRPEWVKVKTAEWREADQERWRLLQQPSIGEQDVSGNRGARVNRSNGGGAAAKTRARASKV